MKALQSQGIRSGPHYRPAIRNRGATGLPQLGIEHVYQGRNDKLNAFNELLSDTGMDEQNICYAGDDWIDIPVLDRVGLAVTVADADDVVKNRVHWVTSREGGRGAVREICDLILAARGLDQAVLDGILNQ